ncbi:ASCH domain-containing protein [Bradyrhizobium sp. 147]|uniref:ASCH domain-containing protein n=1 Tax=unclassified Bradyrhizobium TaxID=2631580 RepID=UPI001FFBFEF9|nr:MULTISPECIES: ASCH domain-containing protein [unclassified Bradyrhizobium]MCK1541760.1 ASCH domain-containing protein [Bradyrhizobium sp. 179]MCK1622259.1 ASCH domain-containing protein [Bradyrhizobium sp. 160]MCK1681626.1 ASCH domain-containing protein [Bradyrhizobium sp. 147]
MAIVNRQFTYKKRIKVSVEDFQAAREGKKTATIRLGIAAVEGENIDLTDGANSLKVKVISVATEPYKALSDQHAQWEGFQNVTELQKDLEKYYRKIDPEQPITTIRFELAG